MLYKNTPRALNHSTYLWYGLSQGQPQLMQIPIVLYAKMPLNSNPAKFIPLFQDMSLH